MKVKHTLASAKDKKPTISAKDLENFVGKKSEIILLEYPLDDAGLTCSAYYHKTRNGKTFYCKSILPSSFEIPEIGKPKIYDVNFIKTIA